MKKNKKKQSTLDDVIRASHRGARQAEQDLLGPGFHAITRVHISKKVYTRKTKHKNKE